MKIHCVLQNPSVKTHLEDLTELVGLQLQASGKRPSFENVFNTLREIGVETDLQTTAHIYSYKFDLTDPLYTTQKRLDALSGATQNRILKKTHTLLKKKELGRDAISIDVAVQLAKMIAPDVGSDPTVQRLIRDRMLKYAKKVAEIKNAPIAGKTSDQILLEALTVDNNQPLASPFGPLGYLQTGADAFAELQQEFADLAANAGSPFQAAQIQDFAARLSAAQYSLMVSHAETQKIIYDVLKDAGLTKEITTKTGPKTVIDWKKVYADNRGSAVLFREIFEKRLTPTGTRLYTDVDIDRIVTALSQEADATLRQKRQSALDAANDRAEKQKPNKRVTDLDRLLDLYDLGIFGQARQSALLKVLGVSASTQKNIDKVESLMRITHGAMKTPITKWSRTFIKTLDREIEREIELMEEGTSAKLKFIRNLLFIFQLNSAIILQNIQNILENIISAIIELGVTALTDRAAAMDTIQIFMNVWADTALGGVREGDDLQNAFSNSAGLSERFSIQNATSMTDKIWTALSATSNILLGSFDNAFKSSLIHMAVISNTKKMLVKNGFTKGEANIMVNQALHGNGPEIASAAKQLTGDLKRAGMRVTKATENRIAAELSYSNLANPQFFKTLVDDAILQGTVRPVMSSFEGLNEPLMRATIAASASSAGKGLGHEADNLLLQPLTYVNKLAAEQVKEGRKKEGTGAIVNAEIMRAGLTALTRFRGGSLRWMALGLQKASGLSFVQTAIEESVRTKWGKALKGDFKNASGWFDLSFDNVDTDSGDVELMTKSLARYQSLRRRLARETAIPILSYTIGYQVLLPYLLEKFTEEADVDDDDKEAEAYAKLGKWIQDDPARKRWFQKVLPLAVYNYLVFQTKTVFGKTSVRSEPRAPEMMDAFDRKMFFGMLTTGYSPPSFTLFEDKLQNELNKDNPEGADIVLADYIGNLLNFGALLKNYELNSNAIKALRGESTRLSDEQKRNVKPEDWKDAFVKSQVDLKNYEKWSGNDRGEISNIGPLILAEYERTGNAKFLPPMVEASITYGGIKYPFEDTFEKKEYIKFVEDFRRIFIDTQLNNYPPGYWDKMPEDTKIAILEAFYEGARELADAEWLKAHPMPSGLQKEVE